MKCSNNSKIHLKTIKYKILKRYACEAYVGVTKCICGHYKDNKNINNNQYIYIYTLTCIKNLIKNLIIKSVPT